MLAPTVLDIFCGAGGFSEGFKQQGFKIVEGIDKWIPAVETFNHNFHLHCIPRNILDFETSVEAIESLPDTYVIIGSPPCVSFSSSNKSGKADKSEGVKLTEIYLRIVAVKKFKRNSELKAWFMENVPRSIKHLQSKYSFKDLKLTEWAIQNNLDPNVIAISLSDNRYVINSVNYGSPQNRERVISGEIIKAGRLILPDETHSLNGDDGRLPYLSISDVKTRLPKPNSIRSDKLIVDPLYPEIQIKQSQLTDHFYDTGLYESQWRNSQFLKTNHPYMGKMSFPENEENPSRTITATKIGTSREAIIYRSEYPRRGNGKFRTPTVREAACIMGFPISYQFVATEGGKWKLVGNAVCPSVSRNLALVVRRQLGLRAKRKLVLSNECGVGKILNLNTYKKRKFNNQPLRNIGSRFRRHPFKYGNITVTLSNYDITGKNSDIGKWITSVQYGNGDGFPHHNFPDGFFSKLEKIIQQFDCGSQFLEIINNGFSERIAKSEILQAMYESDKSFGNFLEPTRLIEEVARIIKKLRFNSKSIYEDGTKIFKKEMVPQQQVLALYALNKIATITNCL